MAGFIHDMALMENLLMETKLCYTVVRPPGLSNGKLNCYLEHGGINGGINKRKKGKLHASQVAHQASAYLRFRQH